jgi:hypothetical protein
MTARADRLHRRLSFALRAAAALAAIAIAVGAPAAAQARPPQAAPWCAFMGGPWGFDCSYYSFEQCMQTARGLGNFCTPNPASGDSRVRKRRRARR